MPPEHSSRHALASGFVDVRRKPDASAFRLMHKCVPRLEPGNEESYGRFCRTSLGGTHPERHAKLRFDLKKATVSIGLLPVVPTVRLPFKPAARLRR